MPNKARCSAKILVLSDRLKCLLTVSKGMNVIALDYSSVCTCEIDILVGDADNIKEQMLVQQIELRCSIESIPASYSGKSSFSSCQCSENR